ncbi:MAG: transposase [Actinomycetota bacterium]
MKQHRYSSEFKVTAVKMANAPDIETKAVAEALHIHPFMLSRWKKELREGTLKGSAHPKLKEVKAMEVTVAEEKRIRELEAALKKARIENDLLKKALQFNLERSRTCSRS